METQETEKLKELCARLDFLPYLTEERFHRIAGIFSSVHFKSGDMIIQKDDMEDSFFILSKGTARVFVEDESDDIKEVRTISEGEYFGEIALITGGIRTAWVVAEGDTHAFKMGREQLATYLMTVPEIAERVLKTAKSRLMS
jgi:CRP-like cAMP-binding protein